MNRRVSILTTLVAAAAVTCGVSHWFFMPRPLESPAIAGDPLAWIQTELHADDVTFAKIKALHRSYLPTCGKMCFHITLANSKVHSLLENSQHMTPELEEAIRDAQLRQRDRRTAMVRHVYEVAALLPPEAGKRYVSTVTARLLEDAPCVSRRDGKKR